MYPYNQAMMGNPNDLEIVSGPGAAYSAGALMGQAPEYMNQLAGMAALMGYGQAPPQYAPQFDPRVAALMGFSLNPFHYLAKGAGAVGTGVSNVLHGHLPWYHPGSPAHPAYPGPAASAPQPIQQLVSAIPGASARGSKVQPLGFTPGTFSVTSGTIITVRARPQRPIRGGRLMGSYARAGTTATGLLTLVSLQVGTDGQLLSGDPISFDALSPNAFGAGVNLTPAAVGQEIVAQVAVSAAPSSTDTIPFNLTLYGLSVG